MGYEAPDIAKFSYVTLIKPGGKFLLVILCRVSVDFYSLKRSLFKICSNFYKNYFKLIAISKLEWIENKSLQKLIFWKSINAFLRSCGLALFC